MEAIPQGVAIVSPDKVEVRPANPCPKKATTTTATMALTGLAEKGADIEVLRQMMHYVAQSLMEIDVKGHCGAGYDETRTDGGQSTVIHRRVVSALHRSCSTPFR